MWVWSLGGEDPLEKGTATHSSVLTWRFPWTEEPGGLQSTGSHRVWHYQVTKHTVTSKIVSESFKNDLVQKEVKTILKTVSDFVPMDGSELSKDSAVGF